MCESSNNQIEPKAEIRFRLRGQKLLLRADQTCRSDDTQLYGSVYPNEYPDLINRFVHCIAEVKAWMKVYKLKLNDEKTEVIL